MPCLTNKNHQSDFPEEMSSFTEKSLFLDLISMNSESISQFEDLPDFINF
jgi:hypothetical protein